MVVRQFRRGAAFVVAAAVVPALVGATQAGAATAQESAEALLVDAGVTLLNSHVSGNHDPDSTALRNVRDTAAGEAARTSPWSDVGVTEVDLSATMLAGAVTLGEEYDYRATTIAGGDHSSTSYHYAGTALDVDRINGQLVSASNDRVDEFMARCGELGAVEVLGPGDPGHDTHLHCAWES